MRLDVLRGVPPAVGLVDRSGATLYVAGGTFPVVRDHPLHLAVAAGGQRVRIRAVRCPHGIPPVARSVAL